VRGAPAQQEQIGMIRKTLLTLTIVIAGASGIKAQVPMIVGISGPNRITITVQDI
jgi:hypothetical protein